MKMPPNIRFAVDRPKDDFLKTTCLIWVENALALY